MAKKQETCGTCQGDRKVTASDFRELTGDEPPAGIVYPDCPACTERSRLRVRKLPFTIVLPDEAAGLFQVGTPTSGKSRHPGR